MNFCIITHINSLSLTLYRTLRRIRCQCHSFGTLQCKFTGNFMCYEQSAGYLRDVKHCENQRQTRQTLRGIALSLSNVACLHPRAPHPTHTQYYEHPQSACRQNVTIASANRPVHTHPFISPMVLMA